MMTDLIKKALGKKNWAVVGVTPNKTKYGYIVFKRLLESGYNVYAINPYYDEIEGNKVYDSLSDISVRIECLSMIVSPKIGQRYIEEAAKLGVEMVWFQPGAESIELIELCKNNNITPIYNACVLVALSAQK